MSVNSEFSFKGSCDDVSEVLENANSIKKLDIYYEVNFPLKVIKTLV